MTERFAEVSRISRLGHAAFKISHDLGPDLAA